MISEAARGAVEAGVTGKFSERLPSTEVFVWGKSPAGP
jgi:hypothetical protein